MEILSTGEKIKRARIYKGATLKDICEDEVSVSKMSCIENGKVAPERWIVKYIAKKLDLDVDYLMKSTDEQIKHNIELLKGSTFNDEVEEKFQYNLDYSLKCKYYNLGFEIVHILFDGYLKVGKFENIQIINSKYYDLCQKSDPYNNRLVYYKDMARYLFMNKEYLQAATYYNSVKKYLFESEMKDYEMLSTVIYNEAACYMMIEDYDKAYEVVSMVIDILDNVKGDTRNAEIYHLLAILSLKMEKENFEQYEEESYKYFKEDNTGKANAMLNYAIPMFENGYKDKATQYIKNGLNIYPKHDKKELVGCMLRCIEVLVENSILDEAQLISNEALNLAITCDEIKHIQKSYYFKSVILQKLGHYDKADMYMNLSTDALFKYANNQERYERYMEMGNMYHKIGDISEAIKYFTLAIGLKKRI